VSLFDTLSKEKQSPLIKPTRSIAVGKKADRTAYDLRYVAEPNGRKCRVYPWSRDYVVHCYSSLQARKFRRYGFRCVADRYSKSEEMNRKCPHRNTMAQLSTPTPTLQIATIHFVRDGRSDGRTDKRQYHANSRSYWVQQNDRLKWSSNSGLSSLVWSSPKSLLGELNMSFTYQPAWSAELC